MNIYSKRFKDNRSSYPAEHKLPISMLLELNHPMIPVVESYDDEVINYEWVEGMTLMESNLKSVEDMMWVLSSCMDLMNTLSTKKYKDKFLFAEDIHALNLIVTPDKQLKLIDLDQIGFYSKANVYRYLNRNYFYIVDLFRCRNYV